MLRGLARFSTGFSTIALRLAAYIFLRWIPTHVLWPAVIFFWILFILSFILLLYLDLEPATPEISVETTDIIEVIPNGNDKAVVETEIDTITIEGPRPISWMETIYLGIPNASPLLSFATIAINAALLLMTLDLTFRTAFFVPCNELAFHRPVPTSPYSANIFIRSAPEATLPLHVFYKPVNTSRWEEGPVVSEFKNETDFTSVVTLDGLRAETKYNYAIVSLDTDIKTVAESAMGQFETFPPEGKRGRWSFGSSSCIKVGLPYNPFGHPLRVKGLEFLEKDMPNLKFFTFLGIPLINS
jgi:alkaline phosphatase D